MSDEVVTGACLCGAVLFEARNVERKAGICHCPMCRKWTGSALIGAAIKTEDIAWTGRDYIRERQTSPWAKRAWCDACGTGLYFEMTLENEWSGKQEIPLGLFDDPNDFEVASEIYIDHKPDGYSFAASDRVVLTRAQCVEKFPLLDDD